MRIVLIIFPIAALMFVAGWFSYPALHKTPPQETLGDSVEVIKRPLDKYAIENLQKADWKPGTITIDKVLGEEKDYTTYLFSFTFNPEVEGNITKKTTGQLNIPKGDGPFPLVLMFRGFVDQKLYTTGTGTRPAAKYFAEHGFMTTAPDFLGYAGSDSEASNVFETRLQTYTTAVALLKTLEQTGNEKELVRASNQLQDSTNVTMQLLNHETISLWAHSNGGQIALTTLVITGANHPTTLWAPASKPFPYVVLYYTDEASDGGKFIRHELAKFEELYDTDKYAYTNYLDSIQAPIQLHQGTADSAVPVSWSNDLVYKLQNKKKDISYLTYPGADHNMRPQVNWDKVVERDVEFFKKHMLEE